MTARSLWTSRVAAGKRQATGSTPLDAGTGAQAAQAVNAASPTSSSLYHGIGVGVGGAILVACALVIVQIVRKRAEHKRALAELEQGHTIEVAQVQDIRSDVPRPVSFARVGRLVPVSHGQAGWGALGSNEEVNEPNTNNHPTRKRRLYISLPKRIKQRSVPLKRLKYLSAIIESPRSRSGHSPTPEHLDLPSLPSTRSRPQDGPPSAKDTIREVSQEGDVFTGPPSSPKPTVLPSFAIRSPGRYGASFIEDSPKAKRSYSVGALIAPAPDADVFGNVTSSNRPPMHARSISLGAHRAASQPPTGPVPPLPVIAPHNVQTTGARSGFCLSRMSSSSQESASSSVLVTSPIVRSPDIMSDSPSLEQMVAEDDSASLKTVSHRKWQNPLVAGPLPIPDTSPTVPASARLHQHKSSVRSNVARYSIDSQLSRELSMTSVASSLESERPNRLSIPRVATADRVSIRSVSSMGSFKNDSGVKKVTTPRRVSRCSTTVSENGSPAERQKTGVLCDISGNAGPPSRQASNATRTSSQSSNGNPFQWDSVPLQKPSALKGSPNARKGHKRQNCVRISTLTPQILGLPPSRPTSPSIMHGIEEEPLDFDSAENTMGGLPFVSNDPCLSRPSSFTAFAPHLRISMLRASLTSSSPDLSSWTTFQDPGYTLQPLNGMSSRSASPGTVAARTSYRQSGQSSNFSMPSFPSPGKTTVTAVQRDQPIPEFYFTRPSTENPGFGFDWNRDSHSPVNVHVPTDVVDIPSSPPLPVAKEHEYHPTCPMLAIPKQDGGREYDPASPAFITSALETDRSSPCASTVTFSDDEARYSRPVSYSDDRQAESPPCSPKTMPQTFGSFALSSPDSLSNSSTPQGPFPSHEKLTSTNASSIMARIRTHSRKVDFPGAPILPPPIEDNPVPFPLSTSRTRSASAAGYLQPHRQAPPPPPLPLRDEVDVPLSLIPGATHQQSPTFSPNDSKRISASPSGPRAKPARSISKQIVALRRMNSEMDTSTSTQSRRYVHGLSREPAPLLPWIGSPEPSESCSDMFDFEFGRDAHGGAVDGADDNDEEATSALDNVDLSDIERRLEGALAGFDVPASIDEETCSLSSEKGCSSPSPLAAQTPQLEEKNNRASSVWEDGENFWNRTSLSTIPGSTPSDAEKARASIAQTPKTRYYSSMRGVGFGRQSHVRTPSVMMATPRSLYDADGFLKT